MLFTNAGTDANLYLSFCQWPKDNKKVLVYGYLKGPHDARESCGDYSKPCYITVTAVPALNGCKDCIQVAAVSFFVIFFFWFRKCNISIFLCRIMTKKKWQQRGIHVQGCLVWNMVLLFTRLLIWLSHTPSLNLGLALNVIPA